MSEKTRINTCPDIKGLDIMPKMAKDFEKLKVE